MWLQDLGQPEEDLGSTQDQMRKFLKMFLRSVGTQLWLPGGIFQPLVIVGFYQLVILITYGIKYFTMEAVSLASILARDGSSSTM